MDQLDIQGFYQTVYTELYAEMAKRLCYSLTNT